MKESMQAEEIIISVWKKKSELLRQGKRPKKLILSAEDYQKIQLYRAGLGELPDPEMDYLQKESLFGLSVYLDEGAAFRVE